VAVLVTILFRLTIPLKLSTTRVQSFTSVTTFDRLTKSSKLSGQGSNIDADIDIFFYSLNHIYWKKG